MSSIQTFSLEHQTIAAPAPNTGRSATIVATNLFSLAVVGIGLLAYFGVIPHINVITTLALTSGGGALCVLSVSLMIIGVVHRMRKEQSEKEQSPLAFTLMSWDMGSNDDFIDSNRNDKLMFKQRFIDNQSIEQKRQDLFKTQLTQLGKADIICLQKTFSTFNQKNLKKVLGEQYEVMDIPKDSKTSCLIAWNRDIFESVPISDPIANLSATTVLLREKQTHLTLLVASTHISGFNLGYCPYLQLIPQITSRGNTELQNLEQFLSSQQADIKIIAGNLNSSKDYPVRQYILEDAHYASASQPTNPTDQRTKWIYAKNSSRRTQIQINDYPVRQYILENADYASDFPPTNPTDQRTEWIYAKSSSHRTQIQISEIGISDSLKLPEESKDSAIHNNPSNHLPVINGFVVTKAP